MPLLNLALRITDDYYTALLNAVERSVHFHGPSGGE